ncbi:MAG: replicative DNA helicase [Opitutales bacterium]
MAAAGGTATAFAPAQSGARDRVAPYSLDAEQALLGCCILEGGQESVTACIEEKLRVEHFYKPGHQVLFQAILDLYNKGQAIDEILLIDKLRVQGQLEEVGGQAYLLEVTNRIETTVNLLHYLRIVRDSAILRQLIRTCGETVERAYEDPPDIGEFLEDVEQSIFGLSGDRISESAQLVRESVDPAIALIHQMLHNKGELTGISTGFRDLDKLLFGMHPAEMLVVAARPSMGKTSIALNMAEAAVLPKSAKGVPTLLFSLEMPSQQLAMRLLCSHARVDMQLLKDGLLQGKDKELIDSAKALKNAPLWIDDSSSLTIAELRAKARRLHAKNHLGLIVVDYLQLIYGTDTRVPREQQIAEISRGLKGMAKELNVPVVVLAQLNRESEREKRQPRMSDLRESGSIEQDADVVLLLSKCARANEEEEEIKPAPRRDLIIAKQRNGPVGTITLTFNKRLTRFENYTARDDE